MLKGKSHGVLKRNETNQKTAKELSRCEEKMRERPSKTVVCTEVLKL